MHGLVLWNGEVETMEIFTLLKANIRHKKGSFISIMLLMFIISMSLTAVLSVRDNCKNSIKDALDDINAPNLTVFINGNKITDKLLNSVKNHSMVEDVEVYQTVCVDKAEANGNEYGNSCFMRKLDNNYKLFKENMKAYEEKTPELKSGEIYIPQGIMTNLKCNVGDNIILHTVGREYRLKIKGIITEPVMGASVIGWKQVFISDEDFERMYADAKQKETAEMTSDVCILQIYKKSDCSLSDGQFKRQLNLDTGIVDNSGGALTRDMSFHYTNLFAEIISSILIVFIGLLLIIIMIVMGHSISTGIEMDYVNLGILKAQGFTQGKIRVILVLQYLLAQMIGVVLGVIFSVPLVRGLSNVFQPITAVLAQNHISFGKSLTLIFVMLLISAVFIVFITKRVEKISPVRAISGGKKEIYFDSRIKFPLCKKGLSASLGLRQFTSCKRRYTGIILIASLLVFFMMTITVLGNAMNSKSAQEAMGEICSECDVAFKKKLDDEMLKKIEKIVEKYSPIEKKYYMSATYFSVNGEEIYCQIYKNPEIITVLKGRPPLYDNEIIITDIIGEELGLKMGDKVIVSHNDMKDEFVISGIYQCMNDAGRSFAMCLKGAEMLGYDNIDWGGYSLKNPEKSGKIAQVLNESFGNILEATNVTDEPVEKTVMVAINAMKAVIYGFSIIFALVVVMMVCTKMFLQEKNDIGIYKAMGFTSINLRVQFAIRFFVVALIGSIFGSGLCRLFSARLLSSLLRAMGITSFAVSYTAVTFIFPISLICICFFIFAFMISRRVRKVEVRQLVTE